MELMDVVEIDTELRYYMRSMGVAVKNETKIFVDNSSVVISTVNPDRGLNKKNVALAYHYVREHHANEVVRILLIESNANYADPFTKGKNSVKHGQFSMNYFIINCHLESLQVYIIHRLRCRNEGSNNMDGIN